MEPLQRLIRYLQRELFYLEIEQDNLTALLELDLSPEERVTASRKYLHVHGQMTALLDNLKAARKIIRNTQKHAAPRNPYPWLTNLNRG